MTNEDIQSVRMIIARMNLDDVKQVYGLLSTRTAVLQQLAKFQYDVGDRVEFASKYGAKIQGPITKINQKTIKIKADGTGVIWTVSPSLLSRIA